MHTRHLRFIVLSDLPEDSNRDNIRGDDDTESSDVWLARVSGTFMYIGLLDWISYQTSALTITTKFCCFLIHSICLTVLLNKSISKLSDLSLFSKNNAGSQRVKKAYRDKDSCVDNRNRCNSFLCVSSALDCITLLLKYGADPQFADHNGNTPLDLAKDDATRTLLQKVLRHNEAFDDKSGEQKVSSSWCDIWFRERDRQRGRQRQRSKLFFHVVYLITQSDQSIILFCHSLPSQSVWPFSGNRHCISSEVVALLLSSYCNVVTCVVQMSSDHSILEAGF